MKNVLVEFGASSGCTFVPLLLQVIDYHVHASPNVCQPASLFPCLSCHLAFI